MLVVQGLVKPLDLPMGEEANLKKASGGRLGYLLIHPRLSEQKRKVRWLLKSFVPHPQPLANLKEKTLVHDLDVDIWVDLPERQYIHLANMIVKEGGTGLAPTLYALSDGRLVNFLFSVNGIGTFASEYKRSIEGEIEGIKVRVLPLRANFAEQEGDPSGQDKLHILLIENVLKSKKSE